jgi:hypothetical protein
LATLKQDGTPHELEEPIIDPLGNHHGGVFSTHLGDTHLIMGAGIDAIKLDRDQRRSIEEGALSIDSLCTKEYVEITTSNEPNDRFSYAMKILRLYLQCRLIGIDRVLVGYRSDWKLAYTRLSTLSELCDAYLERMSLPQCFGWANSLLTKLTMHDRTVITFDGSSNTCTLCHR